MRLNVALVAALISFSLVGSLPADDLTRTIQKDLVALGYDPGNIQGEASTQTVVAISKFQAEHGLEVTGEATPQLAGVIKAEIKKKSQGTAAAAEPAATAKPAPAAASSGGMTAAQALCLQEKVQARQEAEKKKRGFGKLLSAVSRTASRFGGSDIASDISRTSGDIYSANATAADIQGAAEDLGLTETEVEECRNAH